MLGTPCVPPFLPLPLVFVYDLPNCISVSLQHIKLYAFLCFLNPSVLCDLSQCHAVPHPLLPAHCFPPILPLVLCFPSFIFSSFLTNWQEQASVKSALTETTAGSCSYHSATEATRVCTQGMFPEYTKGGSLRSRSYPLDSVILCSRRLCFSHGQVLDFIPSSLLLLHNSLSSLCSSSFPFHTSTHRTVLQKLLFWPLLTGFPPPDCSILLSALSCFSQTSWSFISSTCSVFVSTSLFNFLLSHSNILLPYNTTHKLLLHMFI